ncbi:hypothetical protein HMI54_015084 [Coelomomyces lativittatus]|nr:hypothetical protein HMI55_006741 [Coelomomyces lativittatus]KAJ1512136.1 hypothetical protein HMI56_004463 [Coelomomyces lativittatus]KAJ1513341.1 hypothetical protein HMI54_015084 [Coelomomyces lativittatus]
MSLNSFGLGIMGGTLGMTAFYSSIRNKMKNELEWIKLDIQQLEKGFHLQIQENNSLEPMYYPKAQRRTRFATIWNDVIIRFGKSITGPY